MYSLTRNLSPHTKKETTSIIITTMTHTTAKTPTPPEHPQHSPHDNSFLNYDDLDTAERLLIVKRLEHQLDQEEEEKYQKFIKKLKITGVVVVTGISTMLTGIILMILEKSDTSFITGLGLCSFSVILGASYKFFTSL